MKILVIVNLISGKGKAKEYLSVIREKLKPGNEFKVYITRDKLSTVRFVKEYCREFDMIVVVGGDGTLNEVINGYVSCGCDTPVGYIPAGSTNDFANTLKLVRDPYEACESFLRMNTRKLDIGCFNGTYFTYVAAAGAFSATSYNTPVELKNRLGHLAYILGGIASLPAVRSQHMRITVDGKVYENDYLIVMISNSTSVGGVFSYEETVVSLDDGKFELALLKEPDNLTELGSVIKDVLVRDYDSDYIDFLSGSDITIESPHPVAWSLDGEYGGKYGQMHIVNLERKLNLLI